MWLANHPKTIYTLFALEENKKLWDFKDIPNTKFRAVGKIGDLGKVYFDKWTCVMGPEEFVIWRR